MCAEQSKALAGQPRPRLRGLTRLVLVVLGLWLLGYAYFGRGFAYLGMPPLYVDSLLVAFTGLYLLLRPRWLGTARDPSVLLLLFLMGWGAVRTVPYVGVYGIDALRDSVIWSYGVVAVLTAYLTCRFPLEGQVLRWYARWMGWFPLWAPVALLVYWLYGEALPRFPWGPGGGVPVMNPKGGDVAVHLAGGLAYWLLAQPHWRDRGMPMRLFWLGWLASFALVAFMGRAAFVTIAVVALVLGLHVNPARWVRAISLLTVFVVVMGLLGVEVDVGQERTVSVEQLLTNVSSIFGEVEDFSGEGTKRWRLMWWNEIITYTFFGPYFWTGKGFGINLADDDGFQVSSDGSLRSPHNGHLTVLARAGVPGFLLWILFLGTLMVRLWLSYWRWRSRGERLQAGLRLWAFSYLLAAIINGAFDVYLEGPQGGIWFWSIAGFGMGLLLKDSAPGRNPRSVQYGSPKVKTLPMTRMGQLLRKSDRLAITAALRPREFMDRLEGIITPRLENLLWRGAQYQTRLIEEVLADLCNTLQQDVKLVLAGLGGKVLSFQVVTEKMAEFPFTFFIGLGPGNSVSRTALAAQEGYIRSLPEEWVDLTLSPVTAEILSTSSSSYLFASSSVWSGVSSWLGLFADLGFLGLAAYSWLLWVIWQALGRRFSSWAPTGRAVLVMGVILGMVFSWLETPEFTLPWALYMAMGLVKSSDENSPHPQPLPTARR